MGNHTENKPWPYGKEAGFSEMPFNGRKALLNRMQSVLGKGYAGKVSAS
jgi:hypothetical protein